MAISKHLEFVKESYLQHLWFTVKVVAHLLVLSIVTLIHGFIPWIFIDTASNGMKKIGDKLKDR
jgi:hypothetical protein